ncbi:MAG: hypothetical protein GY711_01830 [bacterium]|nr:hypothetical protein [bacterium]
MRRIEATRSGKQAWLIPASLLLIASVSAAQDVGASSRAQSSTIVPPRRAQLPEPVLLALDAPSAAAARVHYDAPGDGAIWARGANYKAGFDPSGATFYPALGSNAPRPFPVHFTLESVTVGGELQVLNAAAKPERDADQVSFDRGSLIERYALKPKAMEQIFVFGTPLPAGDLSIRIGVESELAWNGRPDGFEFSNEHGKVLYGRAVVFDAHGRRSDAPVSWAADEIEIRVPATFLAEATFPVTVDPLVSTIVIDDFSDTLVYPDVAYDETTDSYLVVYEEIGIFGDTDIYYRQLDAAGVLMREGYVEQGPMDWTRPKVASHNFANKFLVVAEQDNGGFKTVVVRTIDALGGPLGVVQGIDSTEFVSQEEPDVGGDFFDGTPAYFCVVWTEDDLSGRKDIKMRLVDTTGLALHVPTMLTFDAVSDQRPSISKSAGATPSETSVWSIVWERDGGGDQDIWGAQVLWNGTLVHPAFPIDATSFDDTEPSVSSILDGSGERPYMVVFERDWGPDRDIHANVLIGAVSLLSRDLTVLEGVHVFDDQTLPSIDSDGECFVLAFSERVADHEIYMSTYCLSCLDLCLSESRVRVSNNILDDLQVEVTTSYSGGGARRRAMAVYSRGPWDIHGALYDAAANCALGVSYCGPAALNSSGLPAEISAIGSDIASDHSLTLLADQMPTHQFGFFLAGQTPGYAMPPSSQGFICLAGTIGRFNRPGEVLSSGVAGAFCLPVDTLHIPTFPEQSILAGDTWRFQAWFRDNNPGLTSNFTDAVAITFQ